MVDTTDKTYGDTIWLRKKPYERLSAEEKRTGSLLANVEFNALAANSGRWSASFHSLPSGSPMRAVMVPRRPNHVLVHADYSALEVTVLARVTGDRNLIQVFLDGKDIHRYAASKIFEKPESEITSEERRFSKACSFSILYGKGVESFAFDNTGGDVQKAQAIFDAFFKQFPGIKEFIHKAHAEIDRTNAYVTTLLGNKVPIDVNAGGGAKYRQAQKPDYSIIG